MSVLNFSKEKQERDRAKKALSEQLLKERNIYRATLDDIARCDDPLYRRTLAEMLATLCHDHGYASGGAKHV